MARIGVIGGGAFGTALACVVRRKGHETTLWVREPEVVESVNRDERNPVYLKGVPLVPGIVATGDLARAAGGADFLLLAPPAQHMRGVTAQLRAVLAAGTPVVTCSKGIERGTCMLMSQVIAETLPEAPLAVLSGPSFAHEIAADLPTGVTIACDDLALGGRIAHEIGSFRFRTYLSDDVTGALVGGAMKNVLAIACGFAAGMQLGANLRATFLARGLAEMAGLGVSMGARFETFMGLAGIGDLDLSCNSSSSRNTSLGMALGEGRTLAEVLAERVTVQEGVHSAESVAMLAARLGVRMPISHAVDQVLNHGMGVAEAIEQVLSQPFGFDLAGVRVV